jgi:hypothetical protein
MAWRGVHKDRGDFVLKSQHGEGMPYFENGKGQGYQTGGMKDKDYKNCKNIFLPENVNKLTYAKGAGFVAEYFLRDLSKHYHNELKMWSLGQGKGRNMESLLSKNKKCRYADRKFGGMTVSDEAFCIAFLMVELERELMFYKADQTPGRGRLKSAGGDNWQSKRYQEAYSVATKHIKETYDRYKKNKGRELVMIDWHNGMGDYLRSVVEEGIAKRKEEIEKRQQEKENEEMEAEEAKEQDDEEEEMDLIYEV